MEWGQALSSFGAATLEDCTTVFGCHSGTETMLLRTATVVWLIGSLWHSLGRPLLEISDENFESSQRLRFCQISLWKSNLF